MTHPRAKRRSEDPTRARTTPRALRNGWPLALALAAALLIGCGNGDDDSGGGEGAAVGDGEGVVLQGETESGMALEVEPRVAPADDPALRELDAYRESVGAPPVFYTRVTADNSDGDTADRRRPLTVAADPQTLLEEGGYQLRFTCDALEFEWVPQEDDAELSASREDLQERLCPDGGPEPAEVPPGEQQTYYLFIEQGVETQDLAQLSFFGPRNLELVPRDDAP